MLHPLAAAFDGEHVLLVAGAVGPATPRRPRASPGRGFTPPR